MSSPVAAGIDWAGDGWLAVYFEEGSYTGHSFESAFGSLWKGREPEVAIVDVPIGLPEDADSLQTREELDSLARSKIERPSTVFPVPSREACAIAYSDGASYEEVASQNEGDVDKGLNRQSYSIASGIGEVDAFLQRNHSAKQWIIESHPEVCYRALLGQPLQYGKDSAAGVGERLTALETLIDDPGRTLGNVAVGLQGESSRIGIDDVLDAIVLGVTASRGREHLEFLPTDWQRDPEGLPIRMAYWSEESLSK